MRSDELRDAGALTSTALTEITELARDVHRACANRLFGLAGKPGKSIQLLHDGHHGSDRYRELARSQMFCAAPVVASLLAIGAPPINLPTTNRVQLFIFNWNNLMVF